MKELVVTECLQEVAVLFMLVCMEEIGALDHVTRERRIEIADALRAAAARIEQRRGNDG